MGAGANGTEPRGSPGSGETIELNRTLSLSFTFFIGKKNSRLDSSFRTLIMCHSIFSFAIPPGQPVGVFKYRGDVPMVGAKLLSDVPCPVSPLFNDVPWVATIFISDVLRVGKVSCSDVPTIARGDGTQKIKPHINARGSKGPVINSGDPGPVP